MGITTTKRQKTQRAIKGKLMRKQEPGVKQGELTSRDTRRAGKQSCWQCAGGELSKHRHAHNNNTTPEHRDSKEQIIRPETPPPFQECHQVHQEEATSSLTEVLNQQTVQNVPGQHLCIIERSWKNPGNAAGLYGSSGTGHLVTASILAGSGVIPLVEIILPSNITDSVWNSHFSALMDNWFSNRCWRTRLTCWVCNWREGENANLLIIQIHTDKLINHVTPNAIDETLENGWSIGKTKQKNQILVVSRGGVECHLPLIPLPNAHQMKGVAKVKNLVKTRAPCNNSKAEDIRGRGTCSLL